MIDIRQFIESFLLSRKLSLSKLSALLGYKSKTSLDRVMLGSANIESYQKFSQRMVSAFNLTAREQSELRQCVQIAVLGKPQYLSGLEMWAFLRGEVPDAFAEQEADIENVDTGEINFLAERYKDAADIRITMLNCQYVPIYSQLRALLTKKRAEIEHFIYVGADAARTIRAINALSPIIYEKNYMGYVLIDDLSGASRAQGMVGADALVCEYIDAHGAPREDFISFSRPNHGYLATRAPSKSVYGKLLGIPREHYVPLKRTYFDYDAFENYIQFSIDYTALEIDRAVYKIKPDIGIDYVFAGILALAVLEGDMPKNEGFAQVLDELTHIYDTRNKNAFSKRKPAYTIMKRSAMLAFAQTGKTSDHFWGMRAFTLDERVIIFKELIRQHATNHFLHMRFLKDDDALRDVEIAYYDDIGILVLNSSTDYNLSNGHSEAMITHTEFTRLFKDFFLNNLIKHQTLSESETQAYLESLLALCIQNATQKC